MSSSEAPVRRIPVICVAPSIWDGAGVFNPNSWSNASKALIQSCLAEFSVLQHCTEQIGSMCRDSEKSCSNQIATLQQQWSTSRFDIATMTFFCEQPDLHMRIEAFFAGIKSLLDLMVQLLSSEKIVSAAIDGFHRTQGNYDGFHRTQGNYGGSILNALKNNALADKKDVAPKIESLLNHHKSKWIDEVIRARDALVHPQRGMFQLMFQLDCSELAGKFVCTKIRPPQINAIPVDQYTQKTLHQVRAFSVGYMTIIQGKGPKEQ